MPIPSLILSATPCATLVVALAAVHGEDDPRERIMSIGRGLIVATNRFAIARPARDRTKLRPVRRVETFPFKFLHAS